ncbi:acyl-CoA dehydrogenase [Psychrobacter sanguinis]|uniref:acyl-CoA dehydrogenase n=1 Tax=Psychrobacter sanguinis TaxID=861445 RepID=UPI0028994442|nr:acyl-CoA dehydrogenase [Psychrobacter sanguinis]
MSISEEKNGLLARIKASVEALLPITQYNKRCDTFNMTDDIRQKVLQVLVTFSDEIPHPAQVSTDASNLESVNKQKQNNEDQNKNTESSTLLRWQVLAYISGIDLTLAKWFESHLDALSILYELGYGETQQGLWAVWAAEGHPNPIRYQDGKISGSKSWCSGAHIVDYALMTYRDEQGKSQLLTVAMNQSGIDIDNSAWQAVGMQATDTATVTFDHVAATQVGTPNAYLDRVGFWHGAAGVAACWYGATASLASYLIESYQQKPNDYKAMYLGQISSDLAVSRQYLHQVAYLIDSQPEDNHELAIRQLRTNIEQLARQVIETVGQALGAAPFCGNAHFATLSADLTVFIRQSHGAFDLQRIGELTSFQAEGNIWQL